MSRTEREGRAKQCVGREVSALCERSRLMREVRSAKVSGSDTRRLCWRSMVLRDPNREISCCISTIWLFRARRNVRSCWSYQVVDFEVVLLDGFSGRGGSSGTLESLSGVTERWISNKAEGRQGRSRDAMLSEPELRARCIISRTESRPRSSSSAAGAPEVDGRASSIPAESLAGTAVVF